MIARQRDFSPAGGPNRRTIVIVVPLERGVVTVPDRFGVAPKNLSTRFFVTLKIDAQFLASAVWAAASQCR
jgi:hypothetical protein